MTASSNYELEGLRESGDVFGVEVLDEQTEADAVRLAKHYSTLWGATVHLNRVSGLNLSSDPWPASDITLCREITPDQPIED